MEYFKCLDALKNRNFGTYCFLAKVDEGSQIGLKRVMQDGFGDGSLSLSRGFREKNHAGDQGIREPPKPEKGGDYRAPPYMSGQNHP
jgi:hypothetical protein